MEKKSKLKKISPFLYIHPTTYHPKFNFVLDFTIHNLIIVIGIRLVLTLAAWLVILIYSKL